jgi:hypothetical protein
VKGYPLLDSGERHDFDHLLICTGSSYTSPFKFSYKTPEEEKAELAIICKANQSAKSILIIGGGPTACEFAAEIQTGSMDKNKTVTIVTSGIKSSMGIQRSRTSCELSSLCRWSNKRYRQAFLNVLDRHRLQRTCGDS